MKVVIVGAGLGGLTAAICFARHGHEVSILERRPALTPRGGGIVIRPGASSVLHALGLQGDLEVISDRVSTTVTRSQETGEISMRQQPVHISDIPAWGTTRLDVMNLLYGKASETGVTLQFGKLVVNIHDEPESKQPYVELEDGEHLQGDLILVADGISSHLRARMLSDLHLVTEPLVSTTTFYGLTVDVSDLKTHQGITRLINQNEVNIWTGQKGFVVSRHNSTTKQVALLYAIQSETDQKDLWDEHGDIDYVRRFFARSCTELTVPLRIADSCDRWRLAQMPELPRWTTKAGRVALLGDSAHAMHPNSAQGYSQIVEDIGVISFLINEGMRGQPLSKITTTWEKIRRPRVKRIMQFSEWNTRRFSGELISPITTIGDSKRASRRLHEIKPDMNAAFHTSGFLKWLVDFDAVEEAKKHLNDERAML